MEPMSAMSAGEPRRPGPSFWQEIAIRVFGPCRAGFLVPATNVEVAA